MMSQVTSYQSLTYKSMGRWNPVAKGQFLARASHQEKKRFRPPSPIEPECITGPKPISRNIDSKSIGLNLSVW